MKLHVSPPLTVCFPTQSADFKRSLTGQNLQLNHRIACLKAKLMVERAEDGHSMDVVNVLVFDPTPRDNYIIRNLPQNISKKYKFILHEKSDLSFSSLQEYLEDAKKLVIQKNVKIVISSVDIEALLKAALVNEFPHLRGPSVESVFLACNKYYTRCFLDPQPIPFACIDLSAANIDQACEEALKKVGVPAFFKPSTSSGSKGVSSIASSLQLKEFTMSYMNSEVFSSCNAEFFNPFYAKNISDEKYPLASKATAVIEKHVGDVARINADGYVLDGKIFHWSISKNVFPHSKPRYYFGTLLPAILPENTKDKIWNLHDEVVSKMIAFGFNNAFVNVEMFLLDSGEVQLLEVNPRRGGSLLSSGEAFIDGNIFTAELKLAQGENPGPAKWNGRYAFYGYIRTCGTGKARELYDFSYTDSSLFPGVHPEQFVDGSGESGAALGFACLSGDSYEDVMKKYKSMCRRVLLKPELSVWN